VLEGATEAPLNGARVAVDGVAVEQPADETGRWRLTQVPRGRRMIAASADGFTSDQRAVVVNAGATAKVTLKLTPQPREHNEYVRVTEAVPHRTDRGVGAEVRLDRAQLDRFHGSLAENPMSAVHAWPRVNSTSEFGTEFSVRGSPFRHVNLVIDGIPTRVMQHTVYGQRDAGAVPMWHGHLLDSATLRTGAYPRRFDDRLGAELELSIREGSRERFGVHGVVGGTQGLLIGEGPLGSRRGSWLVAARQSYLEWPPRQSTIPGTSFGFSDALAKLVFDFSPSQKVAMTTVAGASLVDEENDVAGTESERGLNRASLFNVSWESQLDRNVMLTQRAYLVRQRFRDRGEEGHLTTVLANDETAYRAGLTRVTASGVLELGAEVAHVATAQNSSWRRAGYAHFSWAATPALTVSPGMRVTSSTLSQSPAVSPWLLAEWSFRPRWSITSSIGVAHQLPELDHPVESFSETGLRPERADQIDLGIEQRITPTVRWQATVFHRREIDVLRAPDEYLRRIGETLVISGDQRYANAIRGSARGIELVTARRSPSGMSGWAAYSYGEIRQRDVERSETFWGDYDQRHSVNLFGAYRFGSQTTVGATFRAGSGMPLPGYFVRTGHDLAVGDVRNVVRLPAYARLDLRADQHVTYRRARLTLFVEVTNALDRTNWSAGSGHVDPITGGASGFMTTQLRRRITGGFVIDY
jgi:hypothetical protein